MLNLQVLCLVLCRNRDHLVAFNASSSILVRIDVLVAVQEQKNAARVYEYIGRRPTVTLYMCTHAHSSFPS